jgi:glycosidase
MQWNHTPNAGFTMGTPWNVIPVTYKTYNVADELKDPSSILNWYKALLALRHKNPAMLEGEYIALNVDDPNVLSYLRKNGEEAVLVVINMSDNQQRVTFDLSNEGLGSMKSKTLLTTQPNLQNIATVSGATLEPFSVYIAEIAK